MILKGPYPHADQMVALRSPELGDTVSVQPSEMQVSFAMDGTIRTFLPVEATRYSVSLSNLKWETVQRLKTFLLAMQNELIVIEYYDGNIILGSILADPLIIQFPVRDEYGTVSFEIVGGPHGS